jgi:hypothetical protein
MSSERDSFAKGKFSTFAKGFLLHKLLLKVNFSPLRVKKSRSHDMGHNLTAVAGKLTAEVRYLSSKNLLSCQFNSHFFRSSKDVLLSFEAKSAPVLSPKVL